MTAIPKWQDITAIFGGTFDPPHIGHREAVRGLFENPVVRDVRVIPAASPPHKPALATAEQRVQMARLNFASTSAHPFRGEVEIDEREIARAAAQGRPSYSFDTLSEIRRENPRIAFVIGADQLRDLHRWYRFPDLLGLCHWIVMERKPDGPAWIQETLGQWQAASLARSLPGATDDRLWVLQAGTFLKVVATVAPALSSTDIRKAIALRGSPDEGTLLPEVLRYLKENKIYGT